MLANLEGEGRIDQALRRLDSAATLLEQRLERHVARAAARAGSVFDADRTSLATELDAARGREKALEAAAAEASAALGEAIAQLRARLDPAEEA